MTVGGWGGREPATAQDSRSVCWTDKCCCKTLVGGLSFRANCLEFTGMWFVKSPNPGVQSLAFHFPNLWWKCPHHCCPPTLPKQDACPAAAPSGKQHQEGQ